MKVALFVIVSICAFQLTACSKKTDNDSLSTSETVKFLHTIDKSDYIELFPDGTVIRNRTLGRASLTGKYVGKYTVDETGILIVEYGIGQEEVFLYESEKARRGEGCDIRCLHTVDGHSFTFSTEGLRETYIKDNRLYYENDNYAEY